MPLTRAFSFALLSLTALPLTAHASWIPRSPAADRALVNPETVKSAPETGAVDIVETHSFAAWRTSDLVELPAATRRLFAPEVTAALETGKPSGKTPADWNRFVENQGGLGPIALRLASSGLSGAALRQVLTHLQTFQEGPTGQPVIAALVGGEAARIADHWKSGQLPPSTADALRASLWR